MESIFYTVWGRGMQKLKLSDDSNSDRRVKTARVQGFSGVQIVTRRGTAGLVIFGVAGVREQVVRKHSEQQLFFERTLDCQGVSGHLWKDHSKKWQAQCAECNHAVGAGAGEMRGAKVLHAHILRNLRLD